LGVRNETKDKKEKKDGPDVRDGKDAEDGKVGRGKSATTTAGPADKS
jgi:hypothetical protein